MLLNIAVIIWVDGVRHTLLASRITQTHVKGVYQKIGYTEVNLRYGSPAVKNREIWGALVPYNEVWRAGANNATTVAFSAKVTLQKTTLDSGKYALFIIPRAHKKWTVIFNRSHQQWGAFDYNKEEDVVRMEVAPKKRTNKVENLNYSIRQVDYQHGSIVLQWAFYEIEIPFETDYIEQFKQEVEQRAAQQPAPIKWVVYLQGAAHLLQIQTHAPLALSWINQGEKIMRATVAWNDQYYPRDYIVGHLYWVKARLLAQNNRFQEAINYVHDLKNLDNTLFYERNKDKESIDLLLHQWKEK